MPTRLPDDKRDAIIADIHNGHGRNAIARAHAVSPSTVTAIAREAGIDDAFDRAATKKATQATLDDNKARRAALARRMLDKANDLLDQMDQPHLVFNIGGKDNVYTEHTMPSPPTGDLRNLMVAAATAIDKHLVLERHDSDTQGLSAVDAWLRDVLGG